MIGVLVNDDENDYCLDNDDDDDDDFDDDDDDDDDRLTFIMQIHIATYYDYTKLVNNTISDINCYSCIIITE